MTKLIGVSTRLEAGTRLKIFDVGGSGVWDEIIVVKELFAAQDRFGFYEYEIDIVPPPSPVVTDSDFQVVAAKSQLDETKIHLPQITSLSETEAREYIAVLQRKLQSLPRS